MEQLNEMTFDSPEEAFRLLALLSDLTKHNPSMRFDASVVLKAKGETIVRWKESKEE